MTIAADFAAADALLAEAFGLQFTLRRGAQQTALTARFATVGARSIDEQNVILDAQACDLIVAAADYQLGGAAVAPAPGDRLVTMVSSQERTYEVLRENDQPCFVEADAEAAMLLVHVKRVE